MVKKLFFFIGLVLLAIQTSAQAVWVSDLPSEQDLALQMARTFAFGEQKQFSTTTRSYTFKTYDLRNNPVSMVDNTGMFSMSCTCVGQGEDSFWVSDNQADYPEQYQVWKRQYKKWKVTVSYKPYTMKREQHSAMLWITYGDVSNRIIIPHTFYIYATGNCVPDNTPPTVSVSATTLNFYKADTKSLKVTGKNLTTILTLSKRGSGQKYFSINKTSISKSDATKGVYVNVTCSPTSSLQRATAYVDIIHNGKVLKTITLSYVKNQMPKIKMVLPDESGDEISEVKILNVSDVPNNTISSLNDFSSELKINSEGQIIIIESPVEQSAIISDISGRAMTVNLQVGRNEIPVNASGIYIVKIREKTTKLMLK